METGVHNLTNTSQPPVTGNPVAGTKEEDSVTKVQGAIKSFVETVDEFEKTVVALEKGLKGIPKQIEEQKSRIAGLSKRINSIFV